jgi:ferrous iron transport protein A
MNSCSIASESSGGLVSPSGAAAVTRGLDHAPVGEVFTVQRIDPDPAVPERSVQLEELGFHPGEQVAVMTRGFPGGDPLVVRVGQSTFALRRAEAACVHVAPAVHRT